MKNLIEGDIRIEGCDIHYYRTGDEKPPIILAHGMTDSGLCWTPVANLLAEYFDVVMYDAQGHGLSGRFDKENPRQNGVKHLYGLMKGLKIKRSVLMGHSMGASTVALLAARHPTLAQAIILEDPPWRALAPIASSSASTAGRRRMMLHERGIAMHQRRRLDDLIDHCRRFNPTWSETDIQYWAESKMQLDPLFFSAAPSPSPFPSNKDMIRHINCPVLLISGDPELGGITTPQVAGELSRLWKVPHRSRWISIEGAGHNIRREQLQSFFRALNDFLREIEEK